MTEAEEKTLRETLHQYWIDADYDSYVAHLEVLHTCPTREDYEFYKEIDEYEG